MSNVIKFNNDNGLEAALEELKQNLPNIRSLVIGVHNKDDTMKLVPSGDVDLADISATAALCQTCFHCIVTGEYGELDA